MQEATARRLVPPTAFMSQLLAALVVLTCGSATASTRACPGCCLSDLSGLSPVPSEVRRPLSAAGSGSSFAGLPVLLAVGESWWTSQSVASAVLAILLSEVLGYEVKEMNVSNSTSMWAGIVGCSSPDCSSTYEQPSVHVGVEFYDEQQRWAAVQAMVGGTQSVYQRAANVGLLGYNFARVDATMGYNIARAAAENLTMGFAPLLPQARRFFTPLRKANTSGGMYQYCDHKQASLLEALGYACNRDLEFDNPWRTRTAGGAWDPYGSWPMQPLPQNGCSDRESASLAPFQAGWTCYGGGWWATPACEATGDVFGKCIVYLDYGKNEAQPVFSSWEQLRLPILYAVIGAWETLQDYFYDYSLGHGNDFMFQWWTPDASVGLYYGSKSSKAHDVDPVEIIYPAGLGYVNAMATCKLVRAELQQEAPDLWHLMQSFSLNLSSIISLQKDVLLQARSSGRDPADGQRDYERTAACAWIRTNAAQFANWMAWLPSPALCNNDEEYIRNLWWCYSCPSGRTSMDGEPCVACPVGCTAHCSPTRDANGTVGSTCSACDNGFYMQGGTCTECSIGHSCDGTMKECPPGTYAARPGLGFCEQCVAGSYTASNGSSTCILCQLGFAAQAAGSTECSACAPGQYNDAVPQSGCRLCDSGSFSREAASRCMLCDAGTYAVGRGNDHCTHCNATLTTDLPGSRTPQDCVCGAGSYRDVRAREVCHPCPSGMECDIASDEAALQHVLAQNCTPGSAGCVIPEAMPGFMTRTHEPLRVFACLDKGNCPGGPPGTCAPLFDSTTVACAWCESGARKAGAECVPCKPGKDVVALVFLVLGFFALLLLVTFMVNRDVILQSNSMLSIIIMSGMMLTAIQTIGVFRNLALEWFEPLASIFKAISVLTFNLDVLHVSCIVKPNATTLYLLRQIVPAFVAIFVLAVILVKKRFLRPQISVYVEYVNSLGSIFSAFFISMTMSCILPLICYKHPGNSGTSMVGDASVLCWDSPEHMNAIFIGAAAFLHSVLPFIVLIAYGTLKHRSFVAESITGDSLGLHAFRFLYLRFQPSVYYYGSVLMARSIVLCLLPVVIRYDTAVQVITMGTILLFGGAVQMDLQPWRTRMDNRADGFVSFMLVLLLMCGVANVGVNPGSLKVLGSCLFGTSCTLLFLLIGWRLLRRLRPAQYFQWFVCHHKRDGAAQARFLKIMLQAMGQSVFIDSDDLKDLDELFDIVRSAVGHLLVYLTREVLTRPWCAGEIATSFTKGIKISSIQTRSFVPPTDNELKDVQNYLDLSSTSLAQYSITFDSVSAAYTHLLLSCQNVVVPSEIRGRQQFHYIVSELLDKRSAQPKQEYKPGMLVVSSDADDQEATAAAGIVVSKISEMIYTFMPEGSFMLVDASVSEEEEECYVTGARALIVILGQGSLGCPEQLRVLAVGMARLLEPGAPYQVIPVNTPKFGFPCGEDYYETTLMKVWPGRSPDDYAAVRTFFKRLSIAFSTHASDAVLATQANQIVERIPRAPMEAYAQRAQSCQSLRRVTGQNTSQHLVDDVDDYLVPTGTVRC